jgi:hypothetical protein
MGGGGVSGDPADLATCRTEAEVWRVALGVAEVEAEMVRAGCDLADPVLLADWANGHGQWVEGRLAGQDVAAALSRIQQLRQQKGNLAEAEALAAYDAWASELLHGLRRNGQGDLLVDDQLGLRLGARRRINELLLIRSRVGGQRISLGSACQRKGECSEQQRAPEWTAHRAVTG